jgi:hypothetical protein
MSRIEIPISEYQGMKTKIRNLEDALNSVSKEAAVNKEVIEKVKTLVTDLENETFLDRLFSWKNIIKPFKELFKKDGEIQKEKT